MPDNLYRPEDFFTEDELNRKEEVSPKRKDTMEKLLTDDELKSLLDAVNRPTEISETHKDSDSVTKVDSNTSQKRILQRNFDQFAENLSASIAKIIGSEAEFANCDLAELKEGELLNSFPLNTVVSVCEIGSGFHENFRVFLSSELHTVLFGLAFGLTSEPQNADCNHIEMAFLESLCSQAVLPELEKVINHGGVSFCRALFDVQDAFFDPAQVVFVAKFQCSLRDSRGTVRNLKNALVIDIPRKVICRSGSNVFHDSEFCFDTNAPKLKDTEAGSAIHLPVVVELGRTSISLRAAAELRKGTVIKLDSFAGAPSAVVVDGKKVAFGTVRVIEETFGVEIKELIEETRV